MQYIPPICLHFDPYKTLVKQFTGFSPIGTHAIIDSPFVTDSQISWYHIEFIFFRNLDSGLCVLWINDMLYPYISYGPNNVIPIILSLYLKPRNVSIPVFLATNFSPTIEVNIVGCFYDNQRTNDFFMYIKNSFLDSVSLSPI